MHLVAVAAARIGPHSRQAKRVGGVEAKPAARGAKDSIVVPAQPATIYSGCDCRAVHVQRHPGLPRRATCKHWHFITTKRAITGRRRAKLWNSPMDTLP